MNYEALVSLFKALNEQERDDIIKLVNREKQLSEERAMRIATVLKDKLVAESSTLDPELKVQMSAVVLDLVGINKVGDIRAPIVLSFEETSMLLDNALGYSVPAYDDDIAKVVLNHVTNEKKITIEPNQAMLTAYLSEKLAHVNVVKKVVDVEQGKAFKAIGFNPDAPSMEAVARAQEAQKATLATVREAQRRAQERPVQPPAENEIVSNDGPENDVMANDIPKKEMKALPAPAVSEINEDRVELLTANDDDQSITITPSADDYRNDFNINYETKAYARDQIHKILTKLEQPDIENNNYGRTFKDMNLWNKVHDGLKLAVKRDNSAFYDLMQHSLFHRSLGEYDEDGRLMNVHLHISNSKILMPNAHSSDDIYSIAALKVLEKGIEKPYLKANFANPEEGKVYLTKMVEHLMKTGYDIEDISVQPRFSEYFDQMKKHILASQNTVSETPDDIKKEKEDVTVEVLTREDINGLISPVSKALAGGKEVKGPQGVELTSPKPIEQFNSDELLKVLEGNRLMSEHFQKDPNEYFLTKQNEKTVELTRAHIEKLIEKIGKPTKNKDTINGLGKNEFAKLKSLYAEGVTKYMVNKPEYVAQLDVFMGSPEAKIAPLDVDPSQQAQKVGSKSEAPKASTEQQPSPSAPVSPERTQPEPETVSNSKDEPVQAQPESVPPENIQNDSAGDQQPQSNSVQDDSADQLSPEEAAVIGKVNKMASYQDKGSYKPKSSDVHILNQANLIPADKITSKAFGGNLDKMKGVYQDAVKGVMNGDFVEKPMYATVMKSKGSALDDLMGKEVSSELAKKKSSKPKNATEQKPSPQPTDSSAQEATDDLINAFEQSPVKSSASIDDDTLPALDEFSELPKKEDLQNDDGMAAESQQNVVDGQENSNQELDDFDLHNMQMMEQAEEEQLNNSRGFSR